MTTKRVEREHPEIVRAVLELEARLAGGEAPLKLVRVFCHGKSICTVWDLGPGRALAKTKTVNRPLPVGYLAGPPRPDPPMRERNRERVDQASLVEQDYDHAQRNVVESCWKGHYVVVRKPILAEAVRRARRPGRTPRTQDIHLELLETGGKGPGRIVGRPPQTLY